MQLLLGHRRDQTCQGSRRLRLHNNGVFSLDDGPKASYVFSGGHFVSSCPNRIRPARVSSSCQLEGPSTSRPFRREEGLRAGCHVTSPNRSRLPGSNPRGLNFRLADQLETIYDSRSLVEVSKPS